MIRKWILAGAGVLCFFLALGAPGAVAWAAPPAQAAAPQEKVDYSPAEYNDYIAATRETNPQQRIKALDDFVAKHPNVSIKLLIPAYRIYYTTYFNELKNYRKAIEYADKMLSYGDKVDTTSRLEAHYIRAVSFHSVYSEKDPTAKEMATRERESALEGLRLLPQWQKPEGASDEQFAQSKKQFLALFNYTAGFTAAALKDYKSAIESFKATLAVNPNDALTYYRMGLAYLQMSPPESMDGFWALARSISLKVQGEAQVRAYLRNQLLRYQQPSCDKLIDPQMNELVMLAAGSGERPATYKIYSAADLQKAREETTNFIIDLKAGGEKAKLVWLATCGLEFPEVVGKVIEVSQTDPVVLKLYNGTDQAEIEAAKTANMDVKLDGQSEAKRIQKDDPVRFSGTLVGYDPEPFMLHWEKAKVNPEDIPAEKTHPAKRAPAKRPAKKATKH